MERQQNMPFDARAAKLLASGQHLTIDEHPGLRLKASASRRTWVYRFKSPVDGRMRQIALGHWPSVSYAAAVVQWEQQRAKRDEGIDVAQAKRASNVAVKKAAAEKRAQRLVGVLTVQRACELYFEGHVLPVRAKKGSDEVKRMFDTMLGKYAGVPAAEFTRTQAFDLISSYAHIPVQAKKLRAELGAAWDYCLDAGRLPDTVPNWWRLILRGKLKSKGHKRGGIAHGAQKRTLSETEITELLGWMHNFSDLVADVLQLYLWTMARGAEIVAMRGSEVGEEAGVLWWTLPKTKTKNRHRLNAVDQRIPLFGRAREIVLARRKAAGEGYLFPSTAAAGHAGQKAIQSKVWFHMPYSETRPDFARPRLQVTDWAPHDLRRTGRTLIAGMGCPDEVGEALLGHMPTGIKGVYNRHSYDAERLHWLKLWSDRLNQLDPRQAS